MFDAEYRDEQIVSRLLEPLIDSTLDVERDPRILEAKIRGVALDLGIRSCNVMGRLEKFVIGCDALCPDRRQSIAAWLHNRRTSGVRSV